MGKFIECDRCGDKRNLGNATISTYRIIKMDSSETEHSIESSRDLCSKCIKDVYRVFNGIFPKRDDS